MKKVYIFLVIVVFSIVIIIFIPKRVGSPAVSVTNFSECANAGYPVIETYPRQCRTPDKKTFVEMVVATSTSIVVREPASGGTISSPLIISGKAKGNWFFEASFPVKLIDATGFVLAEIPAQASGDWMTTDFVPFTARLEFKNPQTKTGELIFSRDNPSGLSTNDEEFRIPVVFKNVSFATSSSSI